MFTRRFSLTEGGPKNLEIKYKFFWKNIEIRYENKHIGELKDKTEAKKGKTFTLSSGEKLHIQLRIHYNLTIFRLLLPLFTEPRGLLVQVDNKIITSHKHGT